MPEILDIQTQLQEAQKRGVEEFQTIHDPHALYEAKTKYLGKKGEVKAILRGLGQLSAEERPRIGQLANQVADALEQAYNERLKVLKEQESQRKLEQDAIDITLQSPDSSWEPFIR